jgi:squalene-associated FAD-dependent desaturase
VTSVAVIGGGLAGITAALRCADAGRDVTLYEARPKLGGLTHSFRRGDLDVDNGQHVFLRCCTAYRGLLDRLGVADHVALQDRLDIPIRSPRHDGAARLRRNGLPAPLHLGGSLLRYRLLNTSQRLRFVRAALAMRGLDRTDPEVDAGSFGDWLREHRQDRQTIDAMWDLVGVATLNAASDQASLALAAMVFQVGLLTEASAADIGWAIVPLQRLHGDAAAHALEMTGAHVLVGAKVDAVEPQGERWLVKAKGGEQLFDAVVLAVPPAAAERLAPDGSLVLADGRALAAGWAERLGTSPIVNVHVVLDRPVMDTPFVAGVGTPIQWVFDRTNQSGHQGPGQYLAVSVSAADEFIDLPVATLRDRLLPDLVALLPAAAAAEVLDFFVTREREATFRPAPGSAALRAVATTRAPGLYVAGAWTDTGWPATMEGAVRSGDAAAAALLEASESGLAQPIRQGVAA